jgi:hypothetical protein
MYLIAKTSALCNGGFALGGEQVQDRRFILGADAG